MGSVDALPMDEAMEHSDRTGAGGEPFSSTRCRRYALIVVLFAAAVFLACVISPPSLMDDVDSVQAQIARNMLDSGDWVTARLDGVAYLEKSPAKYWTIAVSFAVFGVHDWSARLPLATCIGLFLFTRILIPDATLTLFIAFAMWSFLRTLDDAEPRPRLWAAVLAASIAVGMLLKGLIAAVFPVGAAIVYLLATRR